MQINTVSKFPTAQKRGIPRLFISNKRKEVFRKAFDLLTPFKCLNLLFLDHYVTSRDQTTALICISKVV